VIGPKAALWDVAQSICHSMPQHQTLPPLVGPSSVSQMVDADFLRTALNYSLQQEQAAAPLALAHTVALALAHTVAHTVAQVLAHTVAQALALALEIGGQSPFSLEVSGALCGGCVVVRVRSVLARRPCLGVAEALANSGAVPAVKGSGLSALHRLSVGGPDRPNRRTQQRQRAWAQSSGVRHHQSVLVLLPFGTRRSRPNRLALEHVELRRASR